MDYFVGLVKESGISEETAVRIKEYINIKNFFGLSEYLKELNVPDNIKEAFLAFDSLFGGEEMIDRAISYVANDMSVQACERLRRIYKALSYYGYEANIGFDLSMLDGYNYYTGIIFRGYTYGTGNAIVTGGRYNNLLKQFGKDAPSIGFAFKVDELMNAMNRQDIEIPVERTDSIVLYEIENQEAAIAFAMKKRADGRSVELIRKSTRKSLEEYVEYGRRENFESLIFVEENNRTQVFDLSQNN